ncbi:MAG: hypothetical protein Q7S27_01100 [Nanoarchaeota archaeon]|nr:hypothetical protein [Nanoarchaeota archaeon]
MENDEDVYSKIAKLDGVKIVDSSFVKSHLAKGWRDISHRERCRVIGREIKQYYVIDKYSLPDISYPEEMIREFVEFSVNLRNIFDYIRESDSVTLDRFKMLLENRRLLERNVLRLNATERLISQNGGWKSTYLAPSIVIGSGDDVKKCYGYRYEGKSSRKDNDLNDERIFAKALEIANLRPVYILTGDSDFIRMHRKFYEEMDILSELYRFKIPQNPLSIIARFDGDFLKIARPHQELKYLENEKEYSFA